MMKGKKSSENKLIRISEPFFKSKLLIYIGPFSRLLKSHFGEEYNEGGYEGLYHNNVMRIYKYDIPVFIHELQHFTRDMMEHYGVKDDETCSYFMEYYTREFLKSVQLLYAINKKGKKKKKN